MSIKHILNLISEKKKNFFFLNNFFYIINEYSIYFIEILFFFHLRKFLY